MKINKIFSTVTAISLIFVSVRFCSAAVSEPPVGSLETVNTTGNITGWALDPDDISLPTTVNFFIDAIPVSSRTVPVTSVSATVMRDDLGAHGFSANVPDVYKDGNTHALYAYALDLTDPSGASDTLLFGSPTTFTIAAPVILPPVSGSGGGGSGSGAGGGTTTTGGSSSGNNSQSGGSSSGSGGGSGGGVSVNQNYGNQSANSSLKLINNNQTYYLIKDNQQLGITSPGILASYGFTFNMAKTPTALDLALPKGSLLTPADGSLVKSREDQTVYLISGQKRYGFTSANVFLALGFKFSSVLMVTNPELQLLPKVGNLDNGQARHLPGLDINKNGTVYWIGGDSQLHGYPSLSVYNSWHIPNDFSRVVPANAEDMGLQEAGLVTQRLLE